MNCPGAVMALASPTSVISYTSGARSAFLPISSTLSPPFIKKDGPESRYTPALSAALHIFATPKPL